MPYILKDKRMELKEGRLPKNVGELNYIITQKCIEYIREKGLKYQHINDVMGALEGAKAEFYRRVAIQYEDKKIKDNGDVYPWDLTQPVQHTPKNIPYKGIPFKDCSMEEGDK